MAHATAAIRRGRHLSRRGSAMATQEQVDEIMRLAERVHSSDAFRCMDEANAGIGGTMRMLAEARGAGTVVTAGDIAEKLGVTTARVAALLVDELGEDRLRAFFLTAAEIRARLRPPSMHL